MARFLAKTNTEDQEWLDADLFFKPQHFGT